GAGPQIIKGAVQDTAGLTGVAIRLRRRIGRRCAYYSARSERFVPTHCGGGPFFSVGNGTSFTYLLPQRLGRGHYALDIEAADVRGLRDNVPVRGRSEVVFDVR